MVLAFHSHVRFDPVGNNAALVRQERHIVGRVGGTVASNREAGRRVYILDHEGHLDHPEPKYRVAHRRV